MTLNLRALLSLCCSRNHTKKLSEFSAKRLITSIGSFTDAFICHQPLVIFPWGIVKQYWTILHHRVSPKLGGVIIIWQLKCLWLDWYLSMNVEMVWWSFPSMYCQVFGVYSAMGPYSLKNLYSPNCVLGYSFNSHCFSHFNGINLYLFWENYP